MSEACPNQEITMENYQEEDEDHEDEQDMDLEAAGNNYKLVLPEDGYEWKKYGQKFIKNIGKLRSYFKCQKMECMAKKRVEWLASEEPSQANIRVVYKGVHTHNLLASDTSASNSQGTASSSSSNPNQYNLLTQVLIRRNQSPSS